MGTQIRLNLGKLLLPLSKLLTTNSKNAGPVLLSNPNLIFITEIRNEGPTTFFQAQTSRHNMSHDNKSKNL